ncbi:MAG: hypothetical protein QOD90_1557, partial [Mycobacterium sp.]|nr:hypothetical protein [Mycobacterium sp.]
MRRHHESGDVEHLKLASRQPSAGDDAEFALGSRRFN